jgi:hypothetical protein
MLAFTVVTNHVQKIIDAFRALWDFIASGGTTDVLGQLGDIAGRSYLEGFESSLTDLPEIAGRKISEREKQLSDTVSQIGADLGAQFATKFAERAIKLGGVGDALSTEIDLSINKKIDDKLGIGSGLGGSKGGGDALLQASESRLLTRGPANPQQTVLEQLLKKVDEIFASGKNREVAAMETASAAAEIASNTANQTQLVPTP